MSESATPGAGLTGEHARLGSLTVTGDHATMVFRRRLPHPIGRVWAALTEPVERAAWFGATTITDGVIEMMPDDPPAPPDAKRLTGRILVWEPPHAGRAVLEHEWRQRIVEDGTVRYELTADGEDTELVFTHRGLGLRNARGFLPGTHAFLDRLEAHLGGAPLPDWSTRYAEVGPGYA